MNAPLFPQFRTILQVNGDCTDAAITEFAVQHLREKGYAVFAPNQHQAWETPKEFCARLGVHTQTLRRNLDNSGHPYVVVRRGRSGRIIELVSSDAFDAFVKRNLEPARPRAVKPQ